MAMMPYVRFHISLLFRFRIGHVFEFNWNFISPRSNLLLKTDGWSMAGEHIRERGGVGTAPRFVPRPDAFIHEKGTSNLHLEFIIRFILSTMFSWIRSQHFVKIQLSNYHLWFWKKGVHARSVGARGNGTGSFRSHRWSSRSCVCATDGPGRLLIASTIKVI